MSYQEAARFHGHECPGLAIGYRMSLAAMEALDTIRSEDEEIVAIVENDACGVDAVQFVTGCTFGKGNFIFRDYGKQVYTFYCRNTGRGVRVLFHGEGLPPSETEDRAARINRILKAPLLDILKIEEVNIQTPEYAKFRNSLVCGVCGEKVMETRTRDIGGRTLCIPCSKKEV